MNLLRICLFSIALSCCLPDSNKAGIFDWENAKWIGYTRDHRPAEWSGRIVTFNRPPSDISTWVPTERELEERRREARPSVLLRKSFTLNKPVHEAKIAICGLGLYEMYVNGRKAGDRVLDPAQTSYDKRSFYVLHDVTRQLQEGNNALGIMLGNGFYGQDIAFIPGLVYGDPRAILVLNIEFVDGTSTRIVSDESWKANQSPLLFDNIYLGETYDARREIPDWSKAVLDDAGWQPAELMEAATENLLEQKMEPMRKIRQVHPVSVMPADHGEWIIDMGKNMTGWLQIRVEESAGTVVKMRFAEHLMPDRRSIDPASTGIHVTGNVQTDIYICRGGGTETWEPRFTYHGFRYVQISGLSRKPDPVDFTGWLVRTDMARTGTFECPDALIQKFYDVSLLTLEDNIQGILTDCPHRERCAWMGDGHAVGEFATSTFDMRLFWRKTVEDIESVLGRQDPHPGDGLPRDPRAPCNVSVGNRLCRQSRPDWGAATVLLPWYAYVYYGDTIIVQNAWKLMEGWMAYLDEKVVKDGVIEQGYGDWCPPGSNGVMDTPPSLTSTALYYQTLMAMHRMALAIGKTQDAQIYSSRAETVYGAFNDKFFREGDYGSQTGNAVALHIGLVPENSVQKVADLLSRRVMENGGYSTGIFGHRPLYTVLNDNGHAETTRYLWSKTDWPSLGFLTEEHGLTTWPEVPRNWDKEKRYHRNSFNHPMHSGFAATFYESLGGIRPDPDHPGFRQFFLRPCFLPGLDRAKASYRSPAGLIISSWEQGSQGISWSVTVPEGSTAEVHLPEYRSSEIRLNDKTVESNIFSLQPGEWSIRIKP
jgi:alpha-L-rhamnosidase